MESIKDLFKVGFGPSSSHTMGPQIAAAKFLEKNKDADRFIVELYGSLAFTGKGHLTDYIIKKTLGEEITEVKFLPLVNYDYHPNGMKFFSYLSGELIDEYLIFSVGGGSLKELDEDRGAKSDYYKYTNMTDILDYVEREKSNFLEYVLESEDEDILDFSKSIVTTMFEVVEKGIKKTGILPGKLKLKRRANTIYRNYQETKDFNALVFSSTLAVSEENASGEIVVTAPTCGSSGVLPGVLYASYITYSYSIEELAKALLVAGLIGNLVKENASISGAEVGCQGEIGTACSMAAAALCYLKGGTNKQIEYAAEIALEHHLGMTCDPVMGYVQIPCIERNALSSRRAIDSCNFALLTDGEHYIDLDTVIQTLKETGEDLSPHYRETSLGGLAKLKKRPFRV